MNIGLNNTGTICWMNSILQILLSLTSLKDELKKYKDRYSYTHYALYSILQKCEHNSSTLLLDGLMKDLKLKEPKNYSIISSGMQQSASEGLLFIISQLPKIKNIFYHGYYQKIGDEPITKHFGNMFYIFDENKYKKIGLANYILNEFEMINDKEKSLKLFCIPPIVIIALNKYNNKCNLKLPETFNIKGFSDIMNYSKVGDILHHGNLNGGHYTARARRNDKIYLFNDMNVSEVYNLNTLSNTYLTFYEKK